MFLGIFVVIAGVLSLLEVFGLISTDVKWGMPLAVTCIGLSLLFDSIKAKKDRSDTPES
ncbi:MAG: hypothetical protein E6559_15760 [Pantoea sp.]|uniref:hypothetical protein n=1 Tax=Pantoea septica TaxID=472695 RepID=UPI0028A8485E|nr:hypothetical protein [Pantoea septica]MDU6441333.1 hypothetical protein [Pantoea sp.]